MNNIQQDLHNFLVAGYEDLGWNEKPSYRGLPLTPDSSYHILEKCVRRLYQVIMIKGVRDVDTTDISTS